MSLGAPLRRLARDAAQLADDWPRQGAEIVERAVTQELAQAPGRGNVSGIGRATIEVDASPGQATASAAGSMVLWSWLENGTSAHDVAAASTRRTDALSTPYGPRRRVRVRGWRARSTWSRGLARADPQVRRDLDNRFGQLG